MKAVELYFFRHGIAVDSEDPSVTSDQERPLTEDGRRKTRDAAEGLKHMDIVFDKIFTSPWLRASQTADILAEVLELDDPEVLPELAGDRSPDELLGALAHKHGRRTLLVGHEPLLGDTIAQALRGKFHVDMKKSGACAIVVDQLPSVKAATLLWLLTSRQLRLIK